MSHRFIHFFPRSFASVSVRKRHCTGFAFVRGTSSTTRRGIIENILTGAKAAGGHFAGILCTQEGGKGCFKCTCESLMGESRISEG